MKLPGFRPRITAWRWFWSVLPIVVASLSSSASAQGSLVPDRLPCARIESELARGRVHPALARLARAADETRVWLVDDAGRPTPFSPEQLDLRGVQCALRVEAGGVFYFSRWRIQNDHVQMSYDFGVGSRLLSRSTRLWEAGPDATYVEVLRDGARGISAHSMMASELVVRRTGVPDQALPHHCLSAELLAHGLVCVRADGGVDYFDFASSTTTELAGALPSIDQDRLADWRDSYPVELRMLLFFLLKPRATEASIAYWIPYRDGENHAEGLRRLTCPAPRR